MARCVSIGVVRGSSAKSPFPSCRQARSGYDDGPQCCSLSMSLDDAVPVSLLRHRRFVLYWIARVFAAFAFQMIGVAVGWQIYALTGNPFDLGLVGLVQFLPSTVLILIAGQFADRYDRRRILQICQVVEGIAAASLAYATFTGTISKDFILTAVFFLGAARAFESPT